MSTLTLIVENDDDSTNYADIFEKLIEDLKQLQMRNKNIAYLSLACVTNEIEKSTKKI